jgi:hypothetical protein
MSLKVSSDKLAYGDGAASLSVTQQQPSSLTRWQTRLGTSTLGCQTTPTSGRMVAAAPKLLPTIPLGSTAAEAPNVLYVGNVTQTSHPRSAQSAGTARNSASNPPIGLREQFRFPDRSHCKSLNQPLDFIRFRIRRIDEDPVALLDGVRI